MTTEPDRILALDRVSAAEPAGQVLAAWAAALQGTADDAPNTVCETATDLLQGIHGSDVRLPDAASSAPGDRGSSAPEANDLNGEATRLSPQALSLQRQAFASVQASSGGWAAAAPHDVLFDHPLGHAAAPDAAGATTPTQSGAARCDTAAGVCSGDVRDGQAGDALGTSIFNAAQQHRFAR